MRPDASENSQISPSTIVRAARAAGSHPHLASVLLQGRKSANIYASSGVIRGIPVSVTLAQPRMQSLGAKVSPCILLVGRSGIIPPPCFYVAAILLMASVLSARAADEIQVYNAEIAKVGQWTSQLQ